MMKINLNDETAIKLPTLTNELTMEVDKNENQQCNLEIPGRKLSKTNEGKFYSRTRVVAFARKIVKVVEHSCGLWGLTVAKYPIMAAVGSILLVIIFGCGIMKINFLFRPHELWVPENSEFYKVTQWMLKNFPRQYRSEVAIWESENILTASSIQQLWKLHLGVRNIHLTVNNKYISYDEVCLQIASHYTDETYELGKAMGCKDHVCYESSLLELFDYDEYLIYSLTDADVLEAVNFVNISKHFGSPLNVSEFLGGITTDNEGKIIKATSTLQTWLTRINKEAVLKGEYKLDVGTGEKIDIVGIMWENSLVALVREWNRNGYKINLKAGGTLGNVLYQSVTDDAVWIGIGWTVLMLYVILTIGKPMKTDQRIMPAIVGLLVIGMSALASFGLCSMIGVPYGTLTNVLPVLLVALGVDDMYVIVTAWDSIGTTVNGDLAKKAQLTMKRAGTAITVTSLTDIVAFVVGTTTSLPGLRYFCIYSVVGITMVFFLQGTLFVSAMVVNDRWFIGERTSQKGIQHSKKNLKFKTDINFRNFLKAWGFFLMQRFVKISVITLTLAMFLCSVLHIPKMSREFDTFWLIPESSELYKWYATIGQSFPHMNEKGVVVFKGVKLPEEINILKNLTINLRNVSGIVAVKAWFDDVDIEALYAKHPWIKDMTPVKQCEMLIQSLGIEYFNYFHLNLNESSSSFSIMEGEEGIHPCSIFQIEFQYDPPTTFEKKQSFMHAIRNVINKTKVSGFKAAWTNRFSQWETEGILLGELFQNLCIVLSVVGLITLILLTSARASFFVLVCVIFTIADVAFFVHLWGLSVNTMTMIAYVIAVGISVDYAAHIAHDFLIKKGSKNDRVVAALSHMGSAVLHGGFSTFLSFVLLAPSDSYIYISYFKILSSVSVFGLYHALVFLPVLLSLLGPASYPENEFPEKILNNEKIHDIESKLHKYDSASVHIMDVATKSRVVLLDENKTKSFPQYPISQCHPPLDRKSNSLPRLTVSISSEKLDANHKVKTPILSIRRSS